MSGGDAASSKDDEAPQIQRLETDVVNRIAAGEVVAKPANVVKELVENSLDAGSKSIVVTVKEGGMKLLQIQDDGHGIRVEDFGLLCERFTTSKLQKFEDLKQINSFGFRGEALASITHVAHVTIISKTRPSPCAYKGRYSDGKLIPMKSNDKEIKPQPCAGTNGTTITVEDLFYNMQTRRSALKNPNDLYRGILDVMTRYAVHFGRSGVSFTCKKQGQAGADLHTPKKGTVLGNIKVAFGQVLGRELLELKCRYPLAAAAEGKIRDDARAFANGGGEGTAEGEEWGGGGGDGQGSLRFTASGYISNANYSMKKSIFMLFINNRMVESPAIKKTIESVYAPILPNNTHPFVYLAIEMPPSHVDVNVHPTKREVQFLCEDLLLEKLAKAVEEQLSGANTSRTFYGKSLAHGLPPPSDLTQVIGVPTPPAPPPPPPSSSQSSSSYEETATASKKRLAAGAGGGSQPTSSSASTTSKAPAKVPYKMVRTDATMGNLRSFLYTTEQEEEDRSRRSNGSRRRDSSSSAVARGEGGGIGGAVEASCGHDHHEEEDGIIVLDGAKEEGGSEMHSDQENDESLEGASATAQAAAAAVSMNINGTPNKDRHYRRRLPSLVETKCQYLSIRALIADIHDRVHQGLNAILKKHIFVGVIDDTFSLVQHETKLLLIRHVDLCKELFYQLAIRRFGCMPRLSLKANPICIHEALMVALGLPEIEWKEEFGSREELTQRAAEVLIAKGPMLDEYYRININPQGELTSLPDLLMNYTPSPEAIPLFLLRLATEVNWEEEQACFEGIATEIGLFYSDLSAYCDVPLEQPQQQQQQEGSSDDLQLEGGDGGGAAGGGGGVMREEGETGPVLKKYEYLLQHVLYPAFRSIFLPPRDLAAAESQVAVQLAALEELYRVFERC